MKILAIIPARGGSKGVPRKNIKVLGHQPLIAFSISQAIESNCFSKIIVSTDDEEIAVVSKNFGAEVPFLRPAELANDKASSIAVVQHAVDFLEAQNEFYDAICLLQPTSPFREKKIIFEAVEKFKKSNSDALISVLKVPHEYNPHWVFEEDKNGKLRIATGESEIIKRRQDLPAAYFRDGSIYLTKVETIKKGSFYGESLTYILNNPELYVNIDTIDDWEKAEQLLPTILPLL